MSDPPSILRVLFVSICTTPVFTPLYATILLFLTITFASVFILLLLVCIATRHCPFAPVVSLAFSSMSKVPLSNIASLSILIIALSEVEPYLFLLMTLSPLNVKEPFILVNTLSLTVLLVM